MLAIRLGGSGDMTETAVRWKYQRSVPQLPSPLVFGGVLYMVNDNGIVTALHPETGALRQAGPADRARSDERTSRRRSRPTGTSSSRASAASSPCCAPAAISRRSRTNDLQEDVYATPAFADGRI